MMMIDEDTERELNKATPAQISEFFQGRDMPASAAVIAAIGWIAIMCAENKIDPEDAIATFREMLKNAQEMEDAKVNTGRMQ